MSVIRIAAVVVKNPSGEVLSVRKRGTEAFMLPGGKLEPGEAAITTAIRELQEELDMNLDAEELSYLGNFAAPAANEPGFTVECEVFASNTTIVELPTVQAEIDEARWFSIDSTSKLLAPLSRDVVFPVLRD